VITSPFFIIGCSRSGTTLLRSMLNYHPLLAIPVESIFLIDYLRADKDVPVERLKHLMTREYELSEWGMTVTLQDLEGCHSAQEVVDRVYDLYRQRHNKTIWGHKTTTFVRHSYLLKQTYPDAKVIHLIRDPRAVASSLIRSNAHCSNAYFASLRWVMAVNVGLSLAYHYPTDVLEVRFEDLVSAPEPVLQHICAFLEIPFDPAMLNYHTVGTREYGPYYHQMHAHLNKPPDPSRIDFWRSHLKPEDVALIESMCSVTMRELQYELTVSPPLATNRLYVAYLYFEHIWGLLRRLHHSVATRPAFSLSHLRRRLALSLLFDKSLLAETLWYITH
jgi:hypothetical protein